MLKDYDKLWVFGDSYTTPGCDVDPQESFWGLLALYLNINKINNCSRSGNSFDSVCQLLVGLQQEINWTTDLVLIGIPPLERITVFDNHKNTEYQGYHLNTQTWQHKKFDIDLHRGLIALQDYGADKELIIHSDRSWLETQVLRTVFFLTTWLDSIKANYMILNLSKNFDMTNIWGPSKFVLPYCMNHSRCILFQNTYCNINIDINKPVNFDMYGWYGHHGPAGNQYFFEKSLLPTMQRNKLC